MDTFWGELVFWIREKTKFIQFLASKTSDLYSDKKEINIGKQQNNIVISWLDNPDLEKKYSDLEQQYNDSKKEIIEQ